MKPPAANDKTLPAMTSLPLINACLNSLATVFLLAGWYFIRRGQRGQHARCMIGALAASAAFLVCYLGWHGWLVQHTGKGHVPFTAQGPVRTVYFTILFTHLIGSFAIVALVPMTVARAARRQFERHRAIARWTLPIWLYVSITGVIVYLMNYRLFPSSEWEKIRAIGQQERMAG
ncbi:MAG: hypothetical protein RLZZ179_538 [Verrucomicrobiota bacterium]|jgi:uncharacterized membrane protein YozB (DUF420 family)